ncbi:MAG: class I SAM-dependent methyltransferase [Clostridia bacterium]|nr:class I SAM-dependent methyltransferase [Clostridia bacterium]
MDCYNDFASVYDRLTDDIDYKKFVDFVETILLENGLKGKLLLELACGTGNMTVEFNKKGYDVIGVDNSPEMLSVARGKCPDNLLLLQDMTEFELYGTVDAVVCLLDSINYITDETKLKKMFSLVKNYLEYDGLFVFDINSEHKLRNIIGENTFVYNSEDVFYTWENEQNDDCVNFYLTFFVKNETDSFDKIEEFHTEKVYTTEKLVKILNEVGMEFIAAYADFEFNEPYCDSERIFIVARKNKDLT